ncbi:MAG: hypothetical protein ACLQOQ_11690 [Beijerinckiaceae bacterium]
MNRVVASGSAAGEPEPEVVFSASLPGSMVSPFMTASDAPVTQVLDAYDALYGAIDDSSCNSCCNDLHLRVDRSTSLRIGAGSNARLPNVEPVSAAIELSASFAMHPHSQAQYSYKSARFEAQARKVRS